MLNVAKNNPEDISIDFNRKEIFLVRLLLAKRKFHTLAELSEQLLTSKRTVQTIVDRVDYVLKKEGIGSLERVPSKGIRLTNETMKFFVKFPQILQAKSYVDLTIPNERRAYLLISIYFRGTTRVTLDFLINELFVSKKTLLTDLHELRKKAEQYEFTITADRHNGYYFEGNVSQIKTFITDYIMEVFKKNQIYKFIDFDKYILSLLGPSWQDEIVDIHNILKNRLVKEYTEFSICHLETYILLSIETNLNRKNLLNLESIDKNQDPLTLNILTRIGELLNIYFKQSVNAEIKRLVLTLPKKGRKQHIVLNNYRFEVEILVDRLIQSMSNEENIPYYLDPKLSGILINHLTLLIDRIAQNNQLENPYNDISESRYGFISKDLMTQLKQFPLLKDITPNECSYVSIYFASSLEKVKSIISITREALLVSDLPSANIDVITERLKTTFSLDTTVVNNLEDGLEEIKKHHFDIIITTNNICERIAGTDIPVVQLGMNLTKRDEDEIFVVLATPQIDRAPIREAKRLSTLKATLPRENCIFQADYTKPIDIIHKGGELLEKSGYANSMHTGDLVYKFLSLKNIDNFILIPGLLFPHVGICGNAKTHGMSLITLKKPIEVDGQTISVILTFCSSNRYSHKKALEFLSMLLDNNDVVKKFNQMKNYDDLKKYVESKNI